MSEQLGDVLSIMTADGKELIFGDEEVKLLAYGNLGAPPTNWVTRKGYQQHGVTEVDYNLGPRTISVELWHSAACNRQTYWDNRRNLHDFLRPNRTGPLTFTLLTPNGNERSIDVRADPGLVLPPASNNNDWQIREPMDFICFDPIFRSREATVIAMAAAVQTQLVFPITFPITFGTSDLVLTSGAISYTGTWKSYPTITLTGPYTRAVISNLTTGVSIYMSVAIAAGEQRIIDLTPGAQSITDASGNNKFSDLGAGANLTEFAILPDPEVTDGLQAIQIQLVDGINGSSAATLSYYERFFGL